MPHDYSTGKIYLVRFLNNDNSIYIGSTIQDLNIRHRKHKCDQFTTLSKYVKTNYNDDWSQCYIELYENFPCKTKTELQHKEGEIIKIFKSSKCWKCLNRIVVGRTDEEYRKDNKVRKAETDRLYREKNREVVLQKKRLYYHNNKDKHNQKKKEENNA